MKRIYYGSVTCEVRCDGVDQVHNIAMLIFADSVESAKGWAVTKALGKHPQGKLCVVQMFPIPDDWVTDAAKLLSSLT